MEPSTTSPIPTYSAGDLVAGKYVLETLIGEGGMGAVWAATNQLLDAPVAIKLIRTDLSRETLGQRLWQEARAAARLGHPAIVRVFDAGETERGDPFIVMELLNGKSLAEHLLDEGRLTPIGAVQVLLPIADALSVAHAKGIVHRDIKPENVFLVAADDQGVQPKLLDFGIAKLEQRKEPSVLTQMGTVLGSPDYMSPEQARGREDVDYRTDIWSFSVMLYEAVTGRRPFDGSNYNALLRSIVEDEPPNLRELVAGDEALAEIVKTGMMKEPSQRWRSMGELGRALAAWLVQQGAYEDACGVSVEAKWLRRTSSDPARLTPRMSLTSVPDSWEPFTGVQTKRPSGRADTLPATTPAPEPAPEAPPSNRGRWAGLLAGMIAGIVVLVVLAVAARRATSSSPPEASVPSAPRSEPETAPTTQPAALVNEPAPPPLEPAPQEEPLPELEVTPRETAEPAVGRRPVARRRVSPPASSAASPASSAGKITPPAAKEPTLDLLSPY